jgi:hypothetical protein
MKTKYIKADLLTIDGKWAKNINFERRLYKFKADYTRGMKDIQLWQGKSSKSYFILRNIREE